MKHCRAECSDGSDEEDCSKCIFLSLSSWIHCKIAREIKVLSSPMDHWSLQLDSPKNANFSLHSPVLWSSNLSNSWIVFSFSSSQADLMNVICQIFNSISLLRPTAHLGLPPALLFVKKEKNFHTFSKLFKLFARIIELASDQNAVKDVCSKYFLWGKGRGADCSQLS